MNTKKDIIALFVKSGYQSYALCLKQFPENAQTFLSVITWIIYLVIGLVMISPKQCYSQSGACDVTVPFYEVNLIGQPNETYISPLIARNGACCGSSGDRCIEFKISLDTNTIAINFYIASGAIPSGSMYYQINCGTPTPVGSEICLNGPGPYTLTFCKPGNNSNTYGIRAIAAPAAPESGLASKNCPSTLIVNGFIESSLVWNDITSANGLYNAYLDCLSGCDTVNVHPQTGHPPFVDYQVCGTVASPECYGTIYACDTTRMYFCDDIFANATPNDAYITEGQDSVDLYGYYGGGFGPYSTIWKDLYGNVISTDNLCTVNKAGIYTFEVTDSSLMLCPAKAYVSLNANTLPINLLYFGITCNADNENDLYWVTASESNNDYFTIQKSSNAVDFIDIAIIAGSGNSNVIRNYYFTDDNPDTFSYYRLCNTDYNGVTECSEILAPGCFFENNVLFTYPNPSDGNFKVMAPPGSKTIQIYNSNGQLLINKQVDGQNSINISLMDSGIHIVQVIYDENINEKKTHRENVSSQKNIVYIIR